VANNLTGDYQAVVQVSTRLINGLLATLHQNGASTDAPLTLPHSGTLRVGDPRELSPVDLSRGAFGRWLRDHKVAGGSGGVKQLRAQLASMAPPGAARMLEDGLSMLGRAGVPTMPPGIVRGTVKLQCSSPTISLPSGSTSEISLHVDVRAHYYPDPGAVGVAVPEHPLHGDVDATFELTSMSTSTGRKLRIRPSSHDDRIRFTAAPGTNLTAAEADRISAQVRKTVRESFSPLPADLPSDFPFSDFKALGSGSSQAVALPIQLSGAPLSGNHIQSVTNSFIGSSGFAVGVSKEYVRTMLDELFDAVEDAIESFKRVVVKELDVYYTAKLTSGPSLHWSSGAIKFSVGIKLIGHNSPLNFDIDVDQTLTLDLRVSSQSVTIKPVGDPVVHGSIVIDLVELLGGGIVSSIKAARDEALNGGTPSVNDMVQDTFLGAKARLVQGLQSFDDSASVLFTAVEITAHGIIVRGEVGSAARHAPIVRIEETDERQAFTALNSWIPGGRIERLRWSWVEHPGRAKSRIWSGVTKTLADSRHRFILPKPAGITELDSICLRIEGTQTAPDGSVVSITSGEACHVRNSFGPILEAPSWWEPVAMPLWLPDSSDDTILEDAIAGHVTLQGSPPRKGHLTHNSLVYFADWRSATPLDPLARALAAMNRKKVSLVSIVVVPEGVFARPRREVEAKLGSIAERVSVELLLTEDHDGGWTRTFAASKTPSAYLVNARRQFVWKHEGATDPKVLAAALDGHLVPAPAPRSRPLRLAVRPGDRAPDAVFEDDRGQRFAVHRLCGQEALFNFWQSWSAPCIKELRRLQELHARAGERAPLIVAFHGGKDGSVLDRIRKQHKLQFPLVQDADQRIARMYGVHCWPTTISINASGRVGHAQFGLSPAHKEAGS
jgi:peroxiredoxin